MEKFSIEENGYNKEEVNNFINDVIIRTEDIVNRCIEQQKEIERLQSKIKEYEENAFMAKNTIGAAKQKENLIITNAKNMASRILNESLIKAEQKDKDRELLERNMRVYRRKMRVLVEEEKAILDEFDDIELLDDNN